MKKTMLLLLSIFSLFLLTACSNGVPQEDYNSLVKNYSDLQDQHNELQEKYNDLSAEHDSLQSDYGALSERILNNTSEYAYGKAWAVTAFGDDTNCFSDDGAYLQCISGKKYTITDDGISELWSDLLASTTSLALVSQDINYEKISIKFMDPSDVYILDVTLRKNGDSCSLDSIMCNVYYADIIIPAIANLPRN